MQKNKSLNLKNKFLNAWANWDNNIYVIDYIIFALIAVFCYFSFLQGDIMVTGNRAWKLYDSNFFNYYDILRDWTQDNGANYMPTTFVIFAIWVLPLKILGFAVPPTVLTGRLIYNMWYKLLPTLVYFLCAYFIYRIAMYFGLSQRKSKICMISFVTLPVAFFSQFIFSQYDIFTVFFMLLGMFFYFRDKKHDKWWFCLSFGVAVTLKYYSLLIFLVLLLLREKRIWHIIKHCAVVSLFFIIEFAMFFRSPGFKEGVFGFGALSYISQSDFVTGTSGISYFQVAAMFIVIWSYFIKTVDRNDLIKWGMYLCCGICFVIFGLIAWHPQWLLFAAPFWVLSIYVNKNTEKFLWLDCAYILVFYTFVVNHWPGNVDGSMLKNGIWGRFIAGAFITKHTYQYMINPGMDLLGAVMFVLLLTFFVFKHPKYTLVDIRVDDGKYNVWLIRLRLWAAFLLFAIPSFLSYFHTLKSI